MDQMDAKIWLVFHWKGFFKSLYRHHIIYLYFTYGVAQCSHFEGPPSAVHLVYTSEISLGYRMKHLKYFSPNG